MTPHGARPLGIDTRMLRRVTRFPRLKAGLSRISC
jgi:hypothetical protein